MFYPERPVKHSFSCVLVRIRRKYIMYLFLDWKVKHGHNYVKIRLSRFEIQNVKQDVIFSLPLLPLYFIRRASHLIRFIV
jgi:hypothetical protein